MASIRDSSDLINVGFLVVEVNAGIERHTKAMCLPLVAYLLVALTRSFSEFSGAFAETPFTKKIHGNDRIWREWRPSAL